MTPSICSTTPGPEPSSRRSKASRTRISSASNSRLSTPSSPFPRRCGFCSPKSAKRWFLICSRQARSASRFAASALCASRCRCSSRSSRMRVKLSFLLTSCATVTTAPRARGEVVELRHALKHLAPRPEPRIAALVQVRQDLARDVILAELRLCVDTPVDASKERAIDTTPRKNMTTSCFPRVSSGIASTTVWNTSGG